MRGVGLILLVAFAAGLLVQSALASGPTLTASQYRAAANAICGDLGSYTPPNGTVATQFAGALAKAQRALSSLKQLRPPEELASTHQRVTVVIANGLRTFDSLLAKLRSGKLTKRQFLGAVDRVSEKEEDALWKKLGAKVCLHLGD